MRWDEDLDRKEQEGKRWKGEGERGCKFYISYHSLVYIFETLSQHQSSLRSTL